VWLLHSSKIEFVGKRLVRVRPVLRTVSLRVRCLPDAAPPPFDNIFRQKRAFLEISPLPLRDLRRVSPVGFAREVSGYHFADRPVMIGDMQFGPRVPKFLVDILYFFQYSGIRINCQPRKFLQNFWVDEL